jgi:drug/metabolite transporter (DMT)-like permease
MIDRQRLWLIWAVRLKRLIDWREVFTTLNQPINSAPRKEPRLIEHAGRVRLALLVMIVTPLFFSSNLIFGRGVVDEVAPFTLALIRWLAVTLALSPFIFMEWPVVRTLLAASWRRILVLAFLGMWICGGVVYLALRETTATNGTLIYTTSPVLIILLEALFRGRRIGWREAVGAAIAFGGVVTIVLRGDVGALFALRFNSGDLLFVSAAIAWATYSIVYKSEPLRGISNMTLFAVVAGAGALLLFPVAVVEWSMGAGLPTNAAAWGGIGGIIVFASLLAFSGFQFGVRELGAPLAGMFMYLLPPYGVGLAVLFLGEQLEPFHFVGITLVMAGIVLATLPASVFGNRNGASENI